MRRLGSAPPSFRPRQYGTTRAGTRYWRRLRPASAHAEPRASASWSFSVAFGGRRTLSGSSRCRGCFESKRNVAAEITSAVHQPFTGLLGTGIVNNSFRRVRMVGCCHHSANGTDTGSGREGKNKKKACDTVLFEGPKIEDLGNWKRSDHQSGEPTTPLHPFRLSG